MKSYMTHIRIQERIQKKHVYYPGTRSHIITNGNMLTFQITGDINETETSMNVVIGQLKYFCSIV